MFYRYLVLGFFTLSASSLLLKSSLIFWSSELFLKLSTQQKVYALLWGLRFDLASVGYIFGSLMIVIYLTLRVLRFKHIAWAWITWPLLLFIGMEVSDLIYFDNAGRHVSFEVNEIFREANGLVSTAIYSYPFSSLFFLLSAVGLLWLGPRRYAIKSTSFFSIEVPLVLGVFVSLLCIRGSIHDLPMNPDRVYAIGNEQMALIAMAPSYSMIFAALPDREELKPVYKLAPQPDQKFIDQQLGQYLEDKQGEYQPAQKKMNVILFLLESWPAEVMYSYNPQAPSTPSVTPELDALKKRGYSTDGVMASGHRTVSGVFSSLCSFPSPFDSQVVNTKLEAFDYRCLPKLLRDQGWQVSMFQGMHNGQTGNLAQKLGASASFGKLEMPPPTVEKNGWGYHDPDLYKFVLDKAKAEPDSFFYIINNATTHDQHLPPGEPWVFGRSNYDEIQKSVMHYADKALGQFVRDYDAAKLGPTLFIFTADHSAGPRSGPFGDYWLPFSMFATDASVPQKYVAGIGSQIDIAPTILDVLKGHAPWFAGRSLLAGTQAGGMFYRSGAINWVTGNSVIEAPLSDPDKAICYDWRKDLTKTNLRPCSAQDKNRGDFSQAFNWHTQHLLFSGKTAALGKKP
ncbi:LTA synthase family protein [Limnohabitans sp.]|uniref:LTA synthase family protein n=1 Tax=Limnohabitans sp. TaxID=1907725 RepID=UPI00286F7C11|nr:LTA synthase family protein [Limnohabitans sp.]